MNIDSILQRLKIEQLSAMQEKTIAAMRGNENDIVLLSPTGSGKTLAYLLPLQEQVDAENNDVQAIVIVPGRELAAQSAGVLTDMKCGLRAQACYGGRMTMEEHRLMMKNQPQVIFSTPGRLNDHLDKGNINADSVCWLVIDEFDKCLEMGFQEEMQNAVSRLPNVKRRVLLSATDAEQIPRFVNMRRVTRIDCLAAEEQSDKISIFKVISQSKDKLDVLSRLLRQLGDESSIVFLNYRESVERTSDYLLQQGFSVSAFHGGLDQKQREDALFKFSNGSANIFVSTDLGSRGLDIPDIKNIIHYHLPETEQAYIHRIGRTGRWNAQGRAFFLLNQQEQLPEYVTDDVAEYHIADDLPELAKPRMATVYIGKGKKDKLSKGDIVGFLCKKGGLNNSEIGRIDIRERYCYVAVSCQKLQQVIQNASGEKIKGIKTVVEKVE